MRSRILLTTAICLISGFALIGKAEAQLAWFGFSDLCFEGTFKGGSVTNGELTIRIIDMKVEVRCENLAASGLQCQRGGGNAGDITIVVPASADPTKEKGVIFANGCISLDKFDHHSLEGHQHICNPLDNLNKIEVPDSAFVPEIKTEWVLTNGGRVITSGFQTCLWDGSFDEDQCTPRDGPGGQPIAFTCPIDEIISKGGKK